MNVVPTFSDDCFQVDFFFSFSFTSYKGTSYKVTQKLLIAREQTKKQGNMVVDATALKAVTGQVGTLVMDLEGQVLSCTGQLEGDAGEQAAEAVFSILQDSNSVLDASKNEALERVIVRFTSFEYAVTQSGAEIYVVKRSTTAQD